MTREEICDLQFKGLRVIQKDDGFRFGTDAVLLARFASVKRIERVIDLCSGTGIVPILLNGLYAPRSIASVEILPQMADMAKRSMELNHFTNVDVFCRNLIDCHKELGSSFDVVTCNPPYMKMSEGIVNMTDELTVARHEVHCTLEDCIREASRLLKYGGRLCMIHRTERLADVIAFMRAYQLEPKRMQTVHPAVDKPANLVLVEGAKGRNVGLKMEPPVYLYNEHGEMKRLLKEESE